MGKNKCWRIFALLLVIVFLGALAVPAGARSPSQGNGPWWVVTPESEVPLPYDGYLYSQIAPKLREIEQTSNRVRVEVIGQSAGGRNLFLVTLSAPEALGRLGQYQAIRQTMLKDPEKAQEMIEKFGDFKVPVFINGSIHGNEYPGVDAAMRLIEKLAYDNSPETMEILNNMILLINVVQNPDGRVLGTRANANGFDLNRDFITQSQPEVQATVRVLREWNPMIFLDLHGFVNPMLIEPCTPPHNPNYEYDLYIKWAYNQAKAMEAELFAQTGFAAQIPFEDRSQGWDDWPPIFAPMYAMYHGAYGHTLETPYRDARGVDAHYAAVWGALKFVAQNRQAMVRDQVEIFRRGFLDMVQMPIPDEILAETPYNQYNYLTTIDFPTAYIIPAQAPLQQSPQQAARLVDFLIANDVQVEQSSQALTLNGTTYPRGSYVVWMNQPKRGLANTILWTGWDISYEPGLTMYDISGWSHPLLWGVTRIAVEEIITVQTQSIARADPVQGTKENGKAAAYAILPDNNVAIKAVNDLLLRGVVIQRMEQPFVDDGRAFGAGILILPARPELANELANAYGLNVYNLKAVPSGAVTLRRQKIAVFADEGVRFFLKQYGFDFTVVSTNDLNAGALVSDGYDVFVNSTRSYGGLNAVGRASLAAFIAGGGDYIGIGRTGVPFAGAAGANLLTFTTAQGLADDNGVVKLVYNPDDPVSAQFLPNSHGFVYGPIWFTSIGPNVQVAATLDGADFFVSGFWRNWKASSAPNKPVVIHGMNGSADITLIGLNPTFRAHPEITFRLLANAIFNGLP
jgi:hypothetical protein